MTRRPDKLAWVRLRQYPIDELAAAFAESLGAIMRESREAGGYSHAALVQALARSLPNGQLASCEQGDRSVGLYGLLDLCIALERPMPEVVEGALMGAHHILVHGSPRGREPARDGAAEPALDAAESLARELKNGRRAITDNAALRDDIARLRLALATKSEQVTIWQTRAATAENTLENVRANNTSAAAKHAAEIERLTDAHELAIEDLKHDARATLAEARKSHADQMAALMREHATRMERAVSGRPHEPVTGPAVAEPEPGRSWKEIVPQLEIVDGADDHLVRVYNMLTSLQKFTLKALSVGAQLGSIASNRNLATPVLDRHMKQMCRRFRVEGEAAIREVGRKLFDAKGDNENCPTP